MTVAFDQTWKTFPMVYIISGMFLNYYLFMSIVVKKHRQQNIFIYYIVLFMADVIVLLVPLFLEWLKITVNVDVRANSEHGCRFHVWLSGVAMDVPPWVLVIMAYEKRALLWFPVPSDSRFSRGRAKCVMAVLVLLCAFRQQHAFWGNLHNVIVISWTNYTSVSGAAGLHGQRSVQETTTNGHPFLSTSRAVGFNNVSLLDLVPRSRPSTDSREYVCNVINNGYGVFVAMYNPWLDMLLRTVGPYACLLVYNFTIVRKIYREKYCASRLLEKAAIQPPDWFYQGVVEMESIVKRTATLTVLMAVNSLPYCFYFLLQPSSFGTKARYNPSLWLASNFMIFLNYTVVFPVFAVQDHALLVTMRYTWRLPLSRKRGSMTASVAPRIMPENFDRGAVGGIGGKPSVKTAGGLLQKAFWNVLGERVD